MPYKDRACKSCGALFPVTNGRGLYCPGECSHAAHLARVKRRKEKLRDERRAEVRPSGTTDCRQCGAIVNSPNLLHVYCSKECRRVNRNEWQRQHYEATKRVKGKTDELLPVIACGLPECGQAFQPAQPHQRYCSLTCRRRHTRRTSYRAELGKAPILSGKPSRDERQETMREAMRHLGMVHSPGFLSAGYTEERPREVTSTLTSCPHCRAYGKDTLGRVVHSHWCREAV
jgi:hypothetical protein